MIRVARHDPDLQRELVLFRSRVYQKSGRNPDRLTQWAEDEHDRAATHILLYTEVGAIGAALRILDSDAWTLEKYFPFDYDTAGGVEFGRLGVERRFQSERRVLPQLIAAACRYCQSQGKTHLYGFVIERFLTALAREGVPFETLSPSLAPYGEPCFLTGFSIEKLLRFCNPKEGGHDY